MLIIRDYNGDEHPLLAVKVHNSELNGQDDLELTVHQQKNNSLDLKEISELWELNYNNIDYKIIVIQFPQFADFFQVETVVFLLVDGQLQVVLSVQFAIMHFDGKQWMLIAIVISYDQHLITYHSDTLKGSITAF